MKSFKQFLSQKWVNVGHGIISAEVEQALKSYISLGNIVPTDKNTSHSRTNEQPNNIDTPQTMNSSRKRGITLSKEKVDKVRLALEHSKVILDKRSKGLAVEKNEKEKIKATLLKEEIVQFLLDTKKFERREEIKTIPKGLLRIALTAILNIEDSRSINNKINHLRTYNQIDDIIGTKQYRLNL